MDHIMKIYWKLARHEQSVVYAPRACRSAVKYRGTLSVVADDDARLRRLEGRKYLLSFDVPLHLTLKYQ